MGGDGGVIASNRRYMRGAGTADHTGDATRNGRLDPALEREEMQRMMKTCAISNQPLQYGQQTIVVCPYGRLYHKEAAVEALLRRKHSEKDELGSHIRGLKDLHEARFHLIDKKSTPACPITGSEINGNLPAVVLVPGKAGEVNVVSERAFKDMGEKELLEDYGPADERIRLAPPASALKEIKEELEKKRTAEKSTRKSKKDKKRKRSGKDESKEKPPKKTSDTQMAAELAKVKASSKVKESSVLSSLFTKGDTNISEKEKKDNLFARC